MSKELCEEYMQIKEYEAQAAARKLEIEQELLKLNNISKLEGSKILKNDGFRIGLLGRANKTVNAEALRALPGEYPEVTDEVLGTVFRWKPEIDAKAWKEQSEEITNILSRAITVTPAKITFNISRLEE
jgi:hypothetical protein